MSPLGVFNWPPSHDWMLSQALIENKRLKAELVCLQNRNRELEEQNRKLYEQLHLGCDTSGIPPNKDWKKSVAPAEPEKTAGTGASDSGDPNKETPTSATAYLNNKPGDRKGPGGQKGHTPAFLNIDDVVEREPVLHYPERCIRCPRMGICMEEGRFRKYSASHGYDIEIVRVHRLHLLFEATSCIDGEGPLHDDFPEVIGSQFYDTNVQLHVLTWHHIFHGSYDRIGLAAKELLGLSLSAGTANTIVQRVSVRILNSGFMDAVRFFILLFEPVLGADETSACVNGRNAWVHAAVTANVTLLTAHWRRGYEGMIHAGVLQFFTQTLLSDCWASYFNEKFKSKHAVCDGHIMRELVAAAYFREQAWAIDMFDLLLEILTVKRVAVEQGKKCLPLEYIDSAKLMYRLIVKNGFAENPRATNGKTFALLERLDNLEDAVLAFAVDFSVDFTNNASEQALRNLKVALRVAGQFKTISGLADYCIIQSFMDTCRKQGHNPFDMLRIVLSGGDIIQAVFGVEKSVNLKQIIRLTDVLAAGNIDEVEDTKTELQPFLTVELLEAASFGPFCVCMDPPPAKKSPSLAIPKDKMNAARKNILQYKSIASHSASTVLLQFNSVTPP